MTVGFAEHLRAQGVTVQPPRPWRVAWLNFRLHPDFWRPGVETYRQMLRDGVEPLPIIVCERCYVVIDGWHRLAAHWLEGRRDIQVAFCDYHWYGKEHCMVDGTPWIETLRPWSEMECISGAYHRDDWMAGEFAAVSDRFVSLGAVMPTVRLWEWVRAVMFLGVVRGKRILDVGTRESIVPHYLAQRGADVTALDIDVAGFRRDVDVGPGSVTFQQGDATDLPFEDGSFDHVLCTACLKWMKGWEDLRAVEEMARVLRKGGYLAVTVDYGQEYANPRESATGRRIYDEAALYKRIVRPSRLQLMEPADFGRSDWEDWPVESQAPEVYRQGVNVQAAFLLLRK